MGVDPKGPPAGVRRTHVADELYPPLGAEREEGFESHLNMIVESLLRVPPLAKGGGLDLLFRQRIETQVLNVPVLCQFQSGFDPILRAGGTTPNSYRSHAFAPRSYRMAAGVIFPHWADSPSDGRAGREPGGSPGGPARSRATRFPKPRVPIVLRCRSGRVGGRPRYRRPIRARDDLPSPRWNGPQSPLAWPAS